MVDIFDDSIEKLNSIIKDSETCADKIIEHCEEIQKLNTNEEVNALISGIIEATHFQDFTGQRAQKVISNLNEIKSKTGAIEAEEKSDEEQLMQGPQDEAPNQDDIDKLFNEL